MAWSYALRRAGQIPSVFGSSGAKRMPKSADSRAGDAGDVFLPILRKWKMDQDKEIYITSIKGQKRSPASPASPAQYARRLSKSRARSGRATLLNILNGNTHQFGPPLRLRAFAPGAHLFRGPRGETVTSWNRVRGAGLIPSYRTKGPFGLWRQTFHHFTGLARPEVTRHA